MEVWLLCIIAILIFVIAALSVKIYLLHKAANEISEGFSDRLTTETNTLIGISSRDKYMQKLAAGINNQLRKLRKERRRFQEGDKKLKNAVTNISHDLRTPLTAICGYLELLEQEEKTQASGRYVEIIQERANLMKALTEELFRYSMIVSTEEKLTLEPVSLNRALEESIAGFYAVLTEHEITPDIQITERNILCNLDPFAVSRIFSNIINNAVKYSDGDLNIILNEEGIITFSNRASGLDEVQVRKLFNRFYTVEAGKKSTGLGLTIAQILVEQLNGTIAAKYEDERLCIRIQFDLL